MASPAPSSARFFPLLLSSPPSTGCKHLTAVCMHCRYKQYTLRVHRHRLVSLCNPLAFSLPPSSPHLCYTQSSFTSPALSHTHTRCRGGSPSLLVSSRQTCGAGLDFRAGRALTLGELGTASESVDAGSAVDTDRITTDHDDAHRDASGGWRSSRQVCEQCGIQV